MDVLVDNFGRIVEGFWLTIRLSAVAAIAAFVLGTVLAAMRVSPVPVLRAAGTLYVNVVRNTPLVIVFIFVVFGLPELGLRFSFFQRAAVALALYTAAFVCEALRSGINAVHPGQAEAARAIGMTFGQTLGTIVLPQAFRTVIPPLTSILIALVKNSAVAEVFGVTEATYQLDSLVRDNPDALYTVFFGIAAGYILIVLAISFGGRTLERRLAVVR